MLLCLFSVVNNLVLDRIYYGIKLKFLNMFRFMVQVNPIQSYLNLKIGLPPVLKAGSSGTLLNSLLKIFNIMYRSPNLFYNNLNSLINEFN
jgi:hypothetical protein